MSFRGSPSGNSGNEWLSLTRKAWGCTSLSNALPTETKNHVRHLDTSHNVHTSPILKNAVANHRTVLKDLTQVDTDRYAIDTDRYIPRQTFATSDVHHVSSLYNIRLNQSRACSRPLIESFQKTKYVLRRISGEIVNPPCPAATATQ